MLRKLFDSCDGRTTTFAIVFLILGNVYFILGKLDYTWIAFMSTLLGFIVGHSVQENYFGKDDKKDVDNDSHGNPDKP